jgi:uncharacterized protein (TIGR02246 family)
MEARMAAHDPGDVDRLFGESMNAGDLEGLMALYEPTATFTAEPGKVVSGHAKIREALSGMVGLKPSVTLDTKVLANTGEIALLSSRWKMSGTGPDGKKQDLAGESVEVVRRQADGSWKFVIDTPWGLEWK